MSVHVSSNVWRSCPQKMNPLILMLALADLCTDGGYCFASRKSLAKRCRCSERHVQRMLQGLIDAEEIELVQEGGGRGKAPVYLLARYSEGGVLTSFERETSAPERETSATKKVDMPPSQSVSQRNRNNSTNAFGDDVVNIYEAYPLKKGKPSAMRAIQKALKTIDAATLLERTKAFAEARQGDLAFCPHPATWFNDERYNDDPATWRRATDKKSGGRSAINASNSNADRASDY